jgi:TRAP-type C4-dicarboxylate transport system substrate-binding protein
MAGAKDLPVINWKYQCAYPPGDHEAEIAIPERIKYIEKATKGKFRIKRFYAGEIIPAEEILTGVGAGLAELGEAPGVYWSGIDKVFDLSFGLPGTNRGPIGDAFAFQNTSKWSIMLSRIIEEHGAYYIGWHEYGPYPVFCSRVPIRTLSDWKGVKVRVSGYSAKLLQAFGASTTYIPGAEIAQALTTGAIDVGTWSAEAIKDMGFGSVMDYLILPPFIDHIGGVLIANKKAWDSLPEEYRQAVREAEIMAHLNAYKFWRKRMDENIKLAKGVGKGPYGYEVIRLPEKDVAEMNRLAEEVVWDQWAKESPRCAEAAKLLKEWYQVYRH